MKNNIVVNGLVLFVVQVHWLCILNKCTRANYSCKFNHWHFLLLLFNKNVFVPLFLRATPFFFNVIFYLLLIFFFFLYVKKLLIISVHRLSSYTHDYWPNVARWMISCPMRTTAFSRTVVLVNIKSYTNFVKRTVLQWSCERRRRRRRRIFWKFKTVDKIRTLEIKLKKLKN